MMAEDHLQLHGQLLDNDKESGGCSRDGSGSVNEDKSRGREVRGWLELK